MVQVTSNTLTVQGWPGNNAKSYMDGVPFQIYQQQMNISITRQSLNRRLKFDNVHNVISNANNLDSRNFITDGWLPGETFQPQGTANNNSGSFTIVSVTASALIVTGSMNAETGVGSIAENCSLNLTSQITGVEVFYNLVGSTEAENYISKTDVNYLQKLYIGSGLNASDTETVHDLLVGTKSFAWNTSSLTLPNITNSTIVGAGWTGFIQTFTINVYFVTVTVGGNELYNYLRSGIKPSFYPVSYITSVNGKYDQSGLIPHTGNSLSTTGVGSWFNENNAGTVPEYSIGSITYTDLNGNPLTALDIGQNVNVSITVNSATGQFVNAGESPGTKFKVGFAYLPLNSSQYQNNGNQWQSNHLIDGGTNTIGAASTNGSGYGGNNQSLTNIVVTWVSSSQVIITYTVVFSAYIISTLAAQGPGNRNYLLHVITEQLGGSGSNLSDRVCMVVDVNNCIYNQNNAALSKLVDYIKWNTFPQRYGGVTNSGSGVEGDMLMNDTCFLVESAIVNGVMPTLNKVTGMVVAVKPGEPDFIVESQTIDSAQGCLNGGRQVINTSIQRGYKTFPGDAYNTISLVNDDRNNMGTLKAFKFHYSFVLRYDFWQGINTTNPGGANCNNAINNDIQHVNNSWSNLVQNGWNLVYRVYWEVIGYDGWITPFQAQSPIICMPTGTLANAGPQFGSVITYYDINNNPIVGIQAGTQTRIRATYITNGDPLPSGYDTYMGAIMIDLALSGGPSSRRTANTEYASEIGSPFSAAPEIAGATTFVDNGNMSLNIMPDGSIVLETIYDDTIDNWSSKSNATLILVPRLNLKDSAILSAAGNDIKAASGSNILTR